MKTLYSVLYSRIVSYAPQEVEADSEEEALDLVREMAEKGELWEEDVEDDITDVEELGETEQEE